MMQRPEVERIISDPPLPPSTLLSVILFLMLFLLLLFLFLCCMLCPDWPFVSSCKNFKIKRRNRKEKNKKLNKKRSDLSVSPTEIKNKTLFIG